MIHPAKDGAVMVSINREIDADILEIENAVRRVIEAQDYITLAQFRRLKLARHALADFLVTALKVEADPKPAPEKTP